MLRRVASTCAVRTTTTPYATAAVRHQGTKTIVTAAGDGIGPEIMEATLNILKASGARLNYVPITVGSAMYAAGHNSGIAPDVWPLLREHKILLKAPITTPSGGGVKSMNVTLRKTLGLFANVRPNTDLHPFVQTNFPGTDCVIVRENEEDLYAGIEHRQTTEVFQCLKLYSIPGTEAIIHYAFLYARANNRKKVTCLVKDNIMKFTDGLYREKFEQIGKQFYPEIKREVMIVDIGSARIAVRPSEFDVVVTSNLYGDIVSDVVAELTGSVGMAGSFNVGREYAMFEAIHGSAPDIAGKNIANPSGLLQGAVHMLVHIGQPEIAKLIQNAWRRTIEDGIHTADIFRQNQSTEFVGTQEFAQAVIKRLGKEPKKLPKSTIDINEGANKVIRVPDYEKPEVKRELVGYDIFVCWPGKKPDELAEMINSAIKSIDGVVLKMITNRGVKVYPDGHEETFCTDHWRCRFVSDKAGWKDTTSQQPLYLPVEYQSMLNVLNALPGSKIEVIKTENLYMIDGKRGFSLGQGE